MSYYEVQTKTSADGWVNTWTNSWGRPWRFENRKLAKLQLQKFFGSVGMAVARGDMLEDCVREDYRIVLCKSLTSKLKKMMSAVTPEDWVARIKAIHDPAVRVKVANIVWWDYFADRPSPKAWHHLDTYLEAYEFSKDTLSVDRILTGLIKVGYPSGVPHFIAENRVRAA